MPLIYRDPFLLRAGDTVPQVTGPKRSSLGTVAGGAGAGHDRGRPPPCQTPEPSPRAASTKAAASGALSAGPTQTQLGHAGCLSQCEKSPCAGKSMGIYPVCELGIG